MKCLNQEVIMIKTKTRLLTVGMAMIVLLAAALFVIPRLSTTASAAWSGNAADGIVGSGAENDPYQISSGEELAWLANQVNEEGKTFEGNFFVLTADIDLGEKEWTPISYGGYNNSDVRLKETDFKGTLDGQGFTIQNLKISDIKHVGLFGYSSGTIKKLYLENVNISSLNGIGAICANNSGTIEACGVESGTLKISGPNGGNVGGICESNSGTISKCYNMANIVGGSNNGGICAANNSGATINDCYNGGSIEAAGGISNSGICSSNIGNILRCMNFGRLGSENKDNYYGICGTGVGKIVYCFNDKDVSDVPVIGASLVSNSSVSENKSTAELCSGYPNKYWDEKVWSSGTNEALDDPDHDGPRFKNVTYVYPCLKGVSKQGQEPKSQPAKAYAFGKTVNDELFPYTLISSADEFIAIGNNSDSWDKNYVLANDIDLKGRTDVKPIGGEEIYFTGKFSGDGHTISNVTINMPDSDYVGLFGRNTNTITDLYVENGEMIGKSYVGGISGFNICGTIRNCAFSGTVQGTGKYAYDAGGICGYVSSQGTYYSNDAIIENCYSIGSVSSKDQVGGVCGNISQIGKKVAISNCYSVCTVTSTDVGSYIGSVVGGTNSGMNIKITNCYYNSDVSSAGGVGTGLTTRELCEAVPDKLDSSVWNEGSYTVATDGYLRTTTTVYPSLNGVGKAYTIVKYEYNFGIDGKVDWQECAPIKTVDDLSNISNDPSGCYVLVNDIDFDGAEIAPIAETFKGKLGGAGYTIGNFKIDKQSIDPGSIYVGLFRINEGTIMDLAVSGTIFGGSEVGGICGRNNGMIYRCSFDGEVSGAFNGSWVGGISGSEFDGEIRDCLNTAVVRGKVAVGGICGMLQQGQINNSVSTGKVIAEKTSEGTVTENIGGVCGLTSEYGTDITIANCYYDKNVVPAVGSGGDGVTGLASAELCGNTLPTGLDGWTAVDSKAETSAPNGKLRTVTYTYLKPNSLKKTYSAAREEYNFGIDGKDDWQEFTYITTPEEIVAIGNDSKNWSRNYVLKNDIDLNGKDVSPIGRYVGDDLVYFTGRFDGCGHTISNVNINRPFSSTDFSQNAYTGIFGYNNGTIMNLGVEGNIIGYNCVGGICGYNESEGVIYGCSFVGTINGHQYIGGICGYNNKYNTTGDGKISNCYAIADVSAQLSYAGGVCGRNSSLVEYCYSSGAVTVPGRGYVYDPVCFNEGGTSNYCYYNSELCGSGHLYDGGATTNTGLTAQELCSKLPDEFSDSVWEAGSYSVGTADGKFREDSYTYPRFKDRKAYSVENEKRYDFGIEDNHDWQAYTLITTADELADIGGGDPACWAKNYVLGGDIDLNDASKNVSFVPIGTDANNFTGRFSGNGYSIKNISSPLFGVNNGIIEYLTIESGSISCYYSTGSICRDNKTEGIIYCCGNNADVEVANTGNIAGGIAAYNTGLISNCYNAGSVNSQSMAGGICAKSTGTIVYCYNVGLVGGTEKAAAICFENDGPWFACYYDEKCGSSEFGMGSSTWNMTLGIFGDLDDKIWVKKPNTIDSESGRGVAYYPSFSEGFAPSVGFTVTQKFSVLGDEPFVYGSDIVFSANETMEFDTGFSTTNSLSAAYVEMDGKTIANGFSQGQSDWQATWKADTVDEKTFTLVHEYDYYNGKMTKDITVNIEKAELTAADFDFAPANDLVFNNMEKAASVTAKPGMEGVGAVTVKYYSGGELLDSVQVNAGSYAVKISVEEGDFYKAAELEDSSWEFAIAKTAAPAVPDIQLSYSWRTDEDITIDVPGLPENMGEMGQSVIAYSGDEILADNSAGYSDRRLSFHLGPNGENSVNAAETILVTLPTQNYDDITFRVNITLNDKANKEAPSLDEFELVFTENGGDITAEIVTALEGVEYSFDGAYWSSVNTLDVGHDVLVTGYIRYAQTDDMNFSAPVSRQENSGHGTMVHHGRIEPDCTRTGVAEYWECELCARYFLDEDCKTETTLEGTVLAITKHTEMPAVRENEVPATCTTDGSYDEVVYCEVCSTELTRTHMTIPAEGHKWSEKYESDKSGHWHKCEVCSVDSVVEAHVSGGAATEETPETCTTCGYVIAPELGHIHANHLTEVQAKAATCTEDGNNAYFLCSCGKLFSDSAAATEVTAADVTIKAAGHKWSEKYESDKSGHWHKCEVCSADSAVEAHVSGGAATEETPETCTVCGYVITPELGHIHANHLTEVPEKAATCTEDGNTAYFLCDCGKLFSDSAAVTEVTAADVTIKAAGHKWSEKYESDKSGHWHKCGVCSAVSAVEAHVSSGAATSSKAETCTVCGYVINPRKSSSGSGSGGSSAGSSRPSERTETLPAINGMQKSWADIASDLEKQNGGSAVIDLNGETTVPADVIRVIANRKIKAEFVIDSSRSWIIDGSKIAAVSAADLSVLPGTADRSALRGVYGADIKASGTGVPADMKLSFRKEFAGQFANVYKLADNKLVFQGCVKVGEDGSAVISGMSTAGEYVVMVCEFSDLPGDLNNDGALNALDAAAILKDIVGIEKGANPLMGDFNVDGTVNAFDAAAILKHIVGAA